MKNNLDQLEQELMEWDERERKYEKLFGKSTVEGRTFQTQKLAEYERLEIKYGRNDFDRIGSMMLKQRRREMERKLYPRLVTRLMYRFIKAVLSNGKTFANEKAVQSNIKNLHKQVSGAGFSISERRLEQMISQGNREVIIPVSYYVNEAEKMDFQLKFIKDSTGTYSLDHYQARYQNLSNDKDIRSCSFNDGNSPDVSAKQAYNLLAGRATCVGDEKGDRHWVQLDFNDRDALGNHCIKVFPVEYGFDLSQNLEDMGIYSGMDYFSKLKLTNSLENGDKVNVSLDNKAIEIEASPQKKTLNVFENGELRNNDMGKRNTKGLKNGSEQTHMKLVKPLKAKGIHT